MILGVGVDLCKIERVREAMERTGEPFLRKFFTEKEIDLASKTSDVAAYFAARFAVKEAIFKALDIARKGDFVLIAGKGHEEYQEIKGQRIPFSDRECVKEYFK